MLSRGVRVQFSTLSCRSYSELKVLTDLCLTSEILHLSSPSLFGCRKSRDRDSFAVYLFIYF